MKVKLKEIGKIITGNTPSKQNTLYYNSNDILFIKPDILQLKKVCDINDSKEFISENARAVSRIVPKGSLLITCIGIIGKIGIVGIDECAFNQQINAIVPNNNIKSKYLAYVLFYNRGRLNDIANAPVVPIINKSEFENFEVNIIGDIKKQESITQILDKIENIIYKYECVLNHLDTLIKARFVEMFANKGFNKTQIGNLVDCNIASVKVKLKEEDIINYIDISSIDNNLNIIKKPTTYILKDAPSRAQQVLKTNDILVSTVRPNLKNIAIVDINMDNLIGSSGFCILRPQKCTREYLFYCVLDDDFTKKMVDLASGASYPAIHDDDILNYKVTDAPIKLQNEFSNFVHHIDKLKFD